MKKTILVPLDNSEIIKELTRIGERWAQRTEAKIYFLHVGTDKKLSETKQLSLFNDFLKSMEIKSPYDALYETGTSYIEILKVAEKIRPDLMIMGAHSHTTLGRLFLGSNTDYVVHNSSCPVYVYKHQKNFLENKIIVPIDFTLINQPVIKMADQWAQHTQAELIFVRVNPPPEFVGFHQFTSITPEQINKIQQMREEENRKIEVKREHQLHDFVKECHVTSKHRYIICSGKPYEKILEVQQDHKAGLIMMAAHSHTNLDRLLNGSNTNFILHHSNCPVYVYK